MAPSPTLRYIIALCFLIFHSTTVAKDSNSSFNFENFYENSDFKSQLALLGGAKVVSGGSSVKLSGSSNSTSGFLIYKKPINLVEGNPKRFVSFATDFSFSMSQEIGTGLTFSMSPVGFNLNESDSGRFGILGGRKIRVIVVKFDVIGAGVLDKKHSGVNVDSLVSVRLNNLSSIKLGLNSSEKLRAWINYEAGSKRFEIRLAKLGELKPVDPLHSYPIDLSQLWKKDVFMGLSSSPSSGNSSQKCDVYSWRFELRRVPNWMHSEPLDPKAFTEKGKVIEVHKRYNCFMRVLSALIFGTGCGALGAFFVLLIWSIFVERRPVMPEEDAVQPVKFEQEVFKVVVDKAVEDGKK